MPSRRQAASTVLRHPIAFATRVLAGFRANQGLLLAGAVAYYALLSVVPLAILVLIAASQFQDEASLLATLARYCEMVVPGQSQAVVEELTAFLAHRKVLGWVLGATLLFFSSLAFSVLESAMSVIFHHRHAVRRRHLVVSVLIPYGFVLFLGIGLLLVTIVAGALQAMEAESVSFLGRSWSLGGVSGFLLYLLGVGGEILVLTAIYMVMPVGRLSWRRALPGGITAALLWEATRHTLVWYFATLSQVRIVYGSLATSIVALLSFEIAATVLLLGAQVIAEYERVLHGTAAPAPRPARVRPLGGPR
jgi:membrane protein